MSKFVQREKGIIGARTLGYIEPLPPDHKPRILNKGPNSGYKTTEKKAWRQQVWSHLASMSPKMYRKKHNVFLLESLDGLEIEHALRLGFQENRLFVCNGNPAVVAHLKRRYPEIRTYGVSAERAFLRIAEEGHALNLVSLDFCSCLSTPVLETLLACRVALSDAAIVSTNMLRGRERKHFLVQEKTGDELRSEWSNKRSWVYSRNKSVRDKLQTLSSTDVMRHAWQVFTIAIGPTGSPADSILLEATEEHAADDSGISPGDIVWRRGLHVARRCRVRDFGTYQTSNHLTMGWLVIETILGLQATYCQDVETKDGLRAPQKSGSVSSGHTDLNAMGFLV